MIAFISASLLIPLGTYLVTLRLTTASCSLDESAKNSAVQCPSDQVCAKIDARGRTLCVPKPHDAAFELEFPFDPTLKTKVTQNPRMAGGTHTEINTLYAVDLAVEETDRQKNNTPHQIIAGIDGTAYIHGDCTAASPPSCGSGFGNYVQIIDTSHRYLVLYAHLGDVAVKNGYAVKKGDVIGTDGATGLPEPDDSHHPTRWVHWQVNSLENAPQTPDTVEKPAYQTRSVPFRFKKPAGSE